MTGTLHEDLRTYVTVPRRVLLRMMNISDKVCRENQSTHFVFSIFFYRAVSEIMRKKVVERGTHMTTWCTCIARLITKATHTQYVILTAFPLQQWLQECVAVLYVHCLSCLAVDHVHVFSEKSSWHFKWGGEGVWKMFLSVLWLSFKYTCVSQR